MAGGASQLSMARAQVTIAGEVVARRATVTVMGQRAEVIDRAANLELTMDVARIEQPTLRSARITGLDGTVWECQRMGGG